ncbi:TPA: DMT family transporter [Stenotrophomonas maltophilia]
MKAGGSFGLPDVLLLGSAVVWATSYGVTQQAAAWVPVAALLFIRFGLTAVLLAPAWLRVSLPRSEWMRVAGLGALLTVTLSLEAWGVTMTSASNAALLISLCIVLTPMLEWGWLGRRPSGREIAAAVVALAGALLLTSSGTGFSLGDGFFLAAAVTRTLMGVATRKQMVRFPMPALALTGIQSFAVALFAGVVLLAGRSLPSVPSVLDAPAFWAAVAWLIVGCTIFATGAQNLGARHRSATRVALLTGTEPAFGALFASLWLGEVMGAAAWAGAGLIVGGVALALLPFGLKNRGQAIPECIS